MALRADRFALALAALAGAALFGCADAPKRSATPALFAVVPASDGHVGALVVQGDGGTPLVVDRPYAAARVGADGSTQPVTLSPEEVRRMFGPALDALPGEPATFVLTFLEGRDELTAESKGELEKVFNELKRRPLPDILVIGHTDTVGGLSYNDRLSLARAERVRDMLVARGIPPGRIQASGRGERELLVPTEDNVSEARNRRVEINVR